MRIAVHDIERCKSAAKKLSASTSKSLAEIQAHLAASLGYRDWYELRSQSAVAQSPELSEIRVTVLIVDLAEKLQALPGDVQYALTSARLIAPRSLQSDLELRAAVWRQIVGPPARNKPGLLVRDRSSYGRSEPAYLCLAGRPTYVLFDTGPGERGDFEVVRPRIALPDFVPARFWLPYGSWTTADGCEVLFSRDYLPLWRISERGVERLEPWLWIENITRQCHCGATTWASGPSRAAAVADLQLRGVRGLPILVDAMTLMLGATIWTVREAAGALMLTHDAPVQERPGTSINGWLVG